MLLALGSCKAGFRTLLLLNKGCPFFEKWTSKIPYNSLDLEKWQGSLLSVGAVNENKIFLWEIKTSNLYLHSDLISAQCRHSKSRN